MSNFPLAVPRDRAPGRPSARPRSSLDVALIHNYSRVSAGDGLLTDLAIERLVRRGIDRERILVVALDPESFRDLPRVLGTGLPGRRPAPAMVPAVLRLAAAVVAHRTGGRIRIGALTRLLLEADAVVAVGGGFLRARGAVSTIGALLNHVPQLLLAATSRAPVVYLPTSVGPLAGPVGRGIGRLFGGVNVLCARDDRTAEELAPRVRVRRIPDLAVFPVAESVAAGRARPGARAGPAVLVPRELGRDADYEGRLLALARRLPGAVFAVQTEGVRAKSDREFCRRLGVPAGGRLPELLAGGAAGVVVSVRLHGALTALAAGVPAVHLGYQRKSLGAYADLGLKEYLHDARRFDPDRVAAQVRALAREPEEQWRRIRGRLGRLSELSRELDEELDRWLP